MLYKWKRFADNDEPVKANYNKVCRIYRGLFVSNKRIKINANVNDSYNIMHFLILQIVAKY